MDTTAYYAIGIPLYIVLFGVESAVARARHHATPVWDRLFGTHVAPDPADPPFGIGGLLDQRRAARTFEAVRLAVFVPAATIIVWSA